MVSILLLDDAELDWNALTLGPGFSWHPASRIRIFPEEEESGLPAAFQFFLELFSLGSARFQDTSYSLEGDMIVVCDISFDWCVGRNLASLKAQNPLPEELIRSLGEHGNLWLNSAGGCKWGGFYLFLKACQSQILTRSRSHLFFACSQGREETVLNAAIQQYECCIPVSYIDTSPSMRPGCIEGAVASYLAHYGRMVVELPGDLLKCLELGQITLGDVISLFNHIMGRTAVPDDPALGSPIARSQYAVL